MHDNSPNPRLRKIASAASLALLWLAACASPTAAPLPSTPERTPAPSILPAPALTATRLAITPVIATQPQIATAAVAPTTQPPPLAIVPLAANEIGLYELLELEIQTGIAAANPFDPQELDIRVEFTSPSGKVVETGAFWYQDFDPGGHYPKGKPGWRARFTPTETGAWRAVARLLTRSLESAPLTFSVVDSGRHGFVRVHPDNPRYFAFDDGSFFFPIGMNMAWWSGAGDALVDYRKWMDLFSQHDGNAIRVWMADWSFGIEWNDTPLGDYSNRLRRAWLLDQIFKMAEERDMYIMLTLLNCADFNDWQTDGWNRNPYNAARGGPLESPDQYVTDPQARALLKRRMNYIANRWGYSPNLLAWEWWNEVNLAPFSNETLVPWLEEMSAYLKSLDPNYHLITNSFAISHSSPTWQMPEMEIIQKHEYAHQENTTEKDLAGRAAAGFAELVDSGPAKPALLGEFGYGDEGWGKEVDKSGIHLHNGIWATTFVGYAGSGMYWFWDVYVEAYNVWNHFTGLSKYLEGVDLSGYQPFSPLEITTAGGGIGQAAGLGLRGDEAVLVWLRSEAYTVQAAEAAQAQGGSPTVYLPPLVQGQVLTLRDMEPGKYTVTWYDPQMAAWKDPVVLEPQGGRLVIPIPEFRRDLAARVEPVR